MDSFGVRFINSISSQKNKKKTGGKRMEKRAQLVSHPQNHHCR